MTEKSASLYVRMNPQTKAKAEKILKQLGVSPSAAVNMLYRQIILQNGIPFAIKMPQNPVAVNVNSKKFANELHKRYINATEENSIPFNQLIADFETKYHINKHKGE